MSFQPPARREGAPDQVLHLFACGHLAKSLMWSFADVLFGYFAHVHLGMPARDVGWIIFISLAYSGFLDVFAAWFLSAYPGHEGRVPRLQLVGAVVTALASVLLFAPLTLSAAPLFVWLLFASLLFRTGYALYDVSQNALVSLLPDSDAEARRYVTTRTTLSYVAKVLVALTSFAVIGAGEKQSSALLTILPIAAMTVAAAYPMSQHRIGHGIGGITDPNNLGSRPPVRLLLPILLAVAAQICLLGLISRFLPFTQDPHTGASIGAQLVLASVIGGVFGPLLAGHLAREQSRFPLANFMFTTICVASAVLILFAETTVALIAASAIYSVGGGAMSTLVWNELSNVVRVHAQTTARRADLASFALLTATIKLGAAGTGLFMGQLLDGYQGRSTEALGILAAATVAGGLCSVMSMNWGHVRLARHALAGKD